MKLVSSALLKLLMKNLEFGILNLEIGDTRHELQIAHKKSRPGSILLGRP
jgi:hypothetical protein